MPKKRSQAAITAIGHPSDPPRHHHHDHESWMRRWWRQAWDDPDHQAAHVVLSVGTFAVAVYVFSRYGEWLKIA